MGDTIPVTEQSNTITQDIDTSNAAEIVKRLHQCDLEIFSGWKGYQNVLSVGTLAKLDEVSTLCAKHLTSDAKNAGIILSGSGTSGRIAFLISRKFNELAKIQKVQPCYSYIISGGDHALMMSVESREDDWNAGRSELEMVARGLNKVLFVGITCGLSSPFVGGQVEYCLQHPHRFKTYLLGFNPARQARNVFIDGTDKVMLDIALTMEAEGRLLNPVVGPEAIAGSSRMKGATATKMLLEAVFLIAHQSAINDATPIRSDDIIKTYQCALNLTHSRDAEISSLIRMGGNSLIKDGSISYIGWDSLGIMGMIDASECMPTFGANHDDVRCFLGGGYDLLKNNQGHLSSDGEGLEISIDYFMEKRCPKLSENDSVIFIVSDLSPALKQELNKIALLVKSRKSNIALIALNANDGIAEIQNRLGNPLAICIDLPSTMKEEHSNTCYNFLHQCSMEVCLKWVLNAVSTGAHILKGKVYKNIMIDLKLSNRKLFERGVRIVSQCANVSLEEAKECVLKSIYRVDEITSSVIEAGIRRHVLKAGQVEKVIPLAILLTKGFKVDSGLRQLKGCPIVRQCIGNLCDL